MSDIKRLLLGYMYMIWQLCCCIIATLHRLKMDSFSSFLFDILVLKVYSADTIGLVSAIVNCKSQYLYVHFYVNCLTLGFQFAWDYLYVFIEQVSLNIVGNAKSNNSSLATPYFTSAICESRKRPT